MDNELVVNVLQLGMLKALGRGIGDIIEIEVSMMSLKLIYF